VAGTAKRFTIPRLLFVCRHCSDIDDNICHVNRKKFYGKKVAVLVIALCLLPPTSTEYKLLYFFIPFFFFVNHDVRSKSDALHTFLFGLLFINKGYIYFHGDQYVTLNGIANTVIMIAMFIVILVEHFLGLWSKIVIKHEKCERIHNGWSSSRLGNLVKR